MKRMSITEFKRLCENAGEMVFTFDSSNQKDGLCEDCSIVSTFTDVVIMLNPNRICFKGNSSYYCLNRVKYIILLNNDTIGYVFNIICGNRYNDDNNTIHTMIADKKN